MHDNYNSTISQEEILKFEKISDQWWDPNGKFKPLHHLNLVRIKYIKDQIYSRFSGRNLSKINVIDIGCGGGLVSEPLSNIGFRVTGVDASEKNISVAKLHAEKTNSIVNYICTSAEKLVEQEKKYDVVIALEIIEHVSDVDLFLSSLEKITAKSGIIIISTINKNIKSYFHAIIAAEYLLKLLPIGTHSYEKFVKPSKIINFFEKLEMTAVSLTGIKYNFFKQRWDFTKIADVNYMLTLQKD